MSQLEFVERVTIQALAYLQQARAYKPTPEEYIKWVDSHPSAIRVLLLRRGMAACWAGGSPSFQDFILTQRGHSVHDYMAHQLSEADYLRWVNFMDDTTF
jgi:hypothetical protein